ncbi:MAG: flagellar M-ring protein FliF [Bryobacteraceae bacterium]|nr:flagellar M-ring protein FliF [Bryobacteraceae bacterium]
MRKLLASLTAGQRVAILLVVALAGAGIYALARWQKEKDFRPLYAGLSPEDAAAVVERLKESGADYRLSEDGRTVLAPSGRVAELRLAMAAAGLPRNGRIGFELFDRSNFGATEFSEQVNYRRALEGELERSVMSLAAVEQARVHLTFPKESVFLEARQPAKASVLVKLRPGARLTAANAAAVSHLVASAVEGLAPEAVTILDMQGNLLNRPRRQNQGEEGLASEATLEYRQAVERDVAAKIANTLEPLLGPDKFRVSVAAECDFTSGEQSEESFDPSRSVMLASQKTEEYAGSAGAGGTPGTASNLPRPAAKTASSGTGLSRQTESITYQSSRTVRRIRIPQGAVKRMSVAVVVDHEVSWSGEGASRQRTLTPPSPEKLKVIQELASAAAGLNPQRGDQLIVESLPFESSLQAPPAADLPPSAAPVSRPAPPLPAWLGPLRDEKLLVAAGGALGLLLMLIAVIWGWLRRRRKKRVEVELPQQLPAAGPAAAPAEALNRPAETVAELPAAPPKKSEVVAGRLRETVKADPAAAAQILRTWLTEEEEAV